MKVLYSFAQKFPSLLPHVMDLTLVHQANSLRLIASCVRLCFFFEYFVDLLSNLLIRLSFRLGLRGAAKLSFISRSVINAFVEINAALSFLIITDSFLIFLQTF